jgi:hypothetical protein
MGVLGPGGRVGTGPARPDNSMKEPVAQANESDKIAGNAAMLKREELDSAGKGPKRIARARNSLASI